MIFQRVNRTDPERVFVVMRNNEGASMPKDSACGLELASASVDGVRVRQLDTALAHTFVGIVDAAIADGAYGLIQVYGYRSTSLILTTNTSITTGVCLVPVVAQDYLVSSATVLTSTADYTRSPIVAFLCESITTSTSTVSRKIFIRAM
jgi:hypothetical protein